MYLSVDKFLECKRKATRKRSNGIGSRTNGGIHIKRRFCSSVCSFVRHRQELFEYYVATELY